MNGKKELDTFIAKARVLFYKPIQVAEVLYHHRVEGLDITQLDNYRSSSKHWRDDVSRRLVGKVSTSSSRFQDNVFDENAIPESVLRQLAQYNNAHNGLVEAYIYRSMLAKMNDLGSIHTYMTQTPLEQFDLEDLLNLFSHNKGLRRSMDKVYEIVSFALFDTVIATLDVNVHVSFDSKDENLKHDFGGFSQKMFGIDNGIGKAEPARVFRVGATNANDGGLDLWANFGPAIQVKHFTINPEHLTSITSVLKADKIIIVCTDAEKEVIASALHQAGASSKIQSIITLSDLVSWYAVATSGPYAQAIGVKLLQTLIEEFEYEFPSNSQLPLFLAERGYDQLELAGDWEVDKVTMKHGA